MHRQDAGPRVAVVTGAAGQDGSYLVSSLRHDGFFVHGTVRPGTAVNRSGRSRQGGANVIHELDLMEPAGYAELIRFVRPDEFYNLAGMSSVAASFLDPDAAWQTNADAVATMLEAIRLHSPATRFYQSSTSEMFGSAAGEDVSHDEDSPLRPQSPYAAAKAAAHLLCLAYRGAYDLRVACGILFNHESRLRPRTFLTRKVVDHVAALRRAAHDRISRMPPLAMGNMAARRDWGFAPDYVDGMRLIVNQIEVRSRVLGTDPSEATGASYRDYVLGTGELHAVWELVDRAFELAGLPLDWDLAGDPSQWSARFRGTADVAVIADPAFIRPADPAAIRAEAARARTELGWRPRTGLDPFLRDMLDRRPDA